MSGLLFFLRRLDKFAEPIGVNYNGAEKYRTIGGGICSILVTIVLIVYAVGRADQLVNRKWPPVLTTTIEYESYIEDQTKFNLEELKMDVVLKFELLPEKATDPVRSWDALEDKFGRIKAYQVAQEHPFTESHYGNTIGDLDTTADFYLNPRTHTGKYPKVSEEQEIEIEECKEEHFAHESPELMKLLLAGGRRRCLNLEEAHVSGGVLEKSKEHLIIIQWEMCEEYKEEVPGLVCASGQEEKSFFENVKVTLEFMNQFIDYNEKNHEDAMKRRGAETLIVNSHLSAYKNTKGLVELSPNTGIFMDNWLSVYEELDKEEYEYISVDDWKQEPAEQGEDFGFTFVLKRSEREYKHKRIVYSILDYLADIGGLNDALELILEPLIGMLLPALFTRELLNKSFTYDQGKKKGNSFFSNSSGSQADTDSLVQKLRNSVNRINLGPSDLQTMKSSASGLKRFNLPICMSILFEQCKCCFGRESIKHYRDGKENVEKRLDIVKLIKTSIDLDILKKLYLLPRQRNLFKKQRRGAIKVDTSSSSNPDTDSDKDCNIFEASGTKSIMNADLKNTTDRRLLLGIIHRDNDLEPRKMDGAGNQRGAISVTEMSNIGGQDMTQTGLNNGENLIQDLDDHSSSFNGANNRIRPDQNERNRNAIQPGIAKSRGSLY